MAIINNGKRRAVIFKIYKLQESVKAYIMLLKWECGALLHFNLFAENH